MILLFGTAALLLLKIYKHARNKKIYRTLLVIILRFYRCICVCLFCTLGVVNFNSAFCYHCVCKSNGYYVIRIQSYQYNPAVKPGFLLPLIDDTRSRKGGNTWLRQEYGPLNRLYPHFYGKIVYFITYYKPDK